MRRCRGKNNFWEDQGIGARAKAAQESRGISQAGSRTLRLAVTTGRPEGKRQRAPLLVPRKGNGFPR